MKLIDLKEAASILGMSVGGLRAAVTYNRIPAAQKHPRVLFDADEIERQRKIRWERKKRLRDLHIHVTDEVYENFREDKDKNLKLLMKFLELHWGSSYDRENQNGH